MAKNRFNLLDLLDGFFRAPEKTEGSGVDVAVHIRLHRVLSLLLPALEAAGFQFSPDRVIRLKRLLALLPPATDGAALGHALCPIFATDAKQQTDFLAFFRQFHDQVLAEEALEKALAEQQKTDEAPDKKAGDPATPPVPETQDLTDKPTDLPLQEPDSPLNAPQPSPANPSSAPRRPLVVELDRCTDPPYTWNIVPDDDEVAVETGGTFGQTLLRLRRRETSDTETLDIAATVAATIETGGRAELRYRRHTRPTEYLLLVERFSTEDHRAGLFDYFFQTLRANEVLVDRFFYQGDLRICRNEQHPAGLGLPQLRYRYPDARLLVVGTGYRLLSPATGELSEWAEPLHAWRVRVLLTPIAHAVWGQREEKLAEVFSLLPASLQSLHFVAESPEEAAAGQYDALPEYIRRIAETQPLVLAEPVMRSLRQHFDPGLQAWIAACAIYPALHFDLTLRLGRLTSEALGYNLVTAANLLALARLPWFTAGQIPPDVRNELVDFLEARHPALHARVIEYLHRLLDRNPPPENSAAWAQHRINLALLTALRDEQPDAALLDELRAVVKRLDRPERRGDFVLPKAWGKVLEGLGWESDSAYGYSEMVEMGNLSPSQAKDWFDKEMQEGEVGKALSGLARWLMAKYNSPGQMDKWKLEINALQEQLRKLERDVSAGKIKGEDTSREYGLLVVRIFNLKSSLWDAVLTRTTIPLEPEEFKNQTFEEGMVVANRYRLERLIGRGGMADVWQATDVQSEQVVSLKIYRRTDSLGAKLAHYEREMTQFLDHPNINKVLDFGMLGDVPYLVFPYYETSAWHKIGKATEGDLWRIILGIGSALEYMHSLTPPVLHNDIKPEHFMLDSKGNYVLTDFGIAEEQVPYLREGLEWVETIDRVPRDLRRDPELRDWVAQKTVIPEHLAPEQVRGTNFYHESPIPPVDIWHLGASLFYLATGKFPLMEQGGIAQTVRDFSDTRSTWYVPPKLPESFSPEISKLIGRCLEITGRATANQLLTNAHLWLGGTDFPLPEMIPVPGGTFQMGSKENSDEQPIHPVTLSDFEIGKYPVTVEQYMAFANETKSHYPEWLEEGSQYNIKTGSDDHYRKLGEALQAPNHPIVGISWDDAVAYCQWLSQKIPGKKFRLPTEAEWEYAARGGQEGVKNGFTYAGSNKLDEVGWYDKNSGSRTHPVGQKKPNELGLYDLSGNVWEWCNDWYGKYEAADKPIYNPTGPVSGSDRVYRGGSWYSSPAGARVASRRYWPPDDRFNALGFRLARAR